MINRKYFFDTVRPSLFNGALSQGQVQGMEAILAEWDSRQLTDRRYLAYMLATTYHETAKTIQPIAEYGKGKGHKYGTADSATGQVYYGRGFVQLTWKSNYEAMSKITGKDLVHHPEQAMELPVATKILFHGMLNGSFTGKKLSQYFNDTKNDPVEARKIINGLDKADLIAGYYDVFQQAVEQ